MSEKDPRVKNWSIIQVPYGGGFGSLNISRPKGVKNAPMALYKEFMRQKIFMSDNGISAWDNVIWRNISLGLRRHNNSDGWERMHKKVFREFSDLFGKDKNFLFLGGSHTITATTYPVIARARKRGHAGLIVLDAHPDCCRKANWPVHSDWLRWLVEDNYVLPENVLIFGLRQIEKSEKEFLEKYNIEHYSINSLRHRDDFIINNLSVYFALKRFRELAAVYLSVDIDVVSGVYAPGTGCPSPGGLTDTDLVNFVKQLKATLPNLMAIDLVEINPLNWWRKRILRYDPTVDLGVKLIKEIIS